MNKIVRNYKPKKPKPGSSIKPFNLRSMQKHKTNETRQDQPKTKKNNHHITWVSVPYIPQINEKLKKAFTRNNVSFHCSAGPKLGNILSAPNKTKYNPLDKKGIYKVWCSCDPDKCYIGQTRVPIRTRMAQHEADAASQKRINIVSGISKHARECPFGRINWSKPEIIKTMADTNKFFL